MGRIIKFRCWDKRLKKMTTEYGFLVGAGGKFYQDSGWESPTASRDRHEDFVLMQFTGLKDKNIWEDDIITFIPTKGFSCTKRQTARVYYCEKRAAFCVKSKAWDMPIKFNCEEIEVIGNIHENPELLK